MKFIDIHTHLTWTPEENIIRVTDQPGSGYFTIGTHPMFPVLRDMTDAANPDCIGIGECGLDRRYAAEIPLKQQEAIFLAQAELAEKLGKPLVIHSVRTHEEIRNLKKKIQPVQPWILHGFRGNERTAMTMLDAGFFLSFGQGLLRDAGNMQPFFRKIPADRIFFETDEAEGLDIRAVYAVAAELYGIGIDVLREQTGKNFERIFLHHDE